MSYQIYVIMQKRKDGIIYSDMHKTTEKIYFNPEDAEEDRVKDDVLKEHFHVVPIVCMTVNEYESEACR